MNTRFTIILVVVGLAGAGLWAGWRLSRRPPAPGKAEIPAPAPPASAAPTAIIADFVPSTVPATVRPVVSLTNDYWSRLRRVHQLSGDLQPAELRALDAFLRIPETGDAKAQAAEQVLKNDLLNVLRQQRQAPAGLARLLGDLSRDARQSSVMRGYALQHLQLWCGELAGDAAAHSTELVEARRAFTEALSDPDANVCGTALLALHRLAGTDADTAAVRATALKLAQDEQSAPVLRATALQVCAEARLPAALATAVALATHADDVPLQISAIAALGDLGGQEEQALLERTLASGSPRLRAPAKRALQQLRVRLKPRE